MRAWRSASCARTRRPHKHEHTCFSGFNYPLSDWARAIYAGIALVTGLAGLGLFAAPEAVSPMWFWSLTPLLARMTAEWLLGVCSAAVLMAVDNNLRRIRIVAITLITYALLQLIVLVRYADDVSWAMPMAWTWVALLAMMLIVNVWAWLNSRANANRMSWMGGSGPRGQGQVGRRFRPQVS